MVGKKKAMAEVGDEDTGPSITSMIYNSSRCVLRFLRCLMIGTAHGSREEISTAKSELAFWWRKLR